MTSKDTFRVKWGATSPYVRDMEILEPIRPVYAPSAVFPAIFNADMRESAHHVWITEKSYKALQTSAQTVTAAIFAATDRYII